MPASLDHELGLLAAPRYAKPPEDRFVRVTRIGLMVQMEKVAQLRKAWIAKGDPPCDHPKTDTEYYLGTQTGDTACLVCGRSWPRGSTPPGQANGMA